MPHAATSWKLNVAWPWPPWTTALLVIFAVAFVTATYLRGHGASRRYRLTLAGIRLGAVAVLLLMIAQVTLLVERLGRPCAAMLIDDSRSMTIADRSGRSRWDQAGALLTEREARLLRQLDKAYDLRLYYLSDFSHGLRAAPAELAQNLLDRRPACENTRLGDGIRAVLDDSRGAAPAAVVVLTDGINTEGSTPVDAADAARRRGVPLYSVGSFGPSPRRRPSRRRRRPGPVARRQIERATARTGPRRTRGDRS